LDRVKRWAYWIFARLCNPVDKIPGYHFPMLMEIDEDQEEMLENEFDELDSSDESIYKSSESSYGSSESSFESSEMSYESNQTIIENPGNFSKNPLKMMKEDSHEKNLKAQLDFDFISGLIKK
jgi:hypothetical protein